MQPINSDFVLSQSRVAAVAVVAYLSGRGVFTPADVTLLTALGTAFGPILVPWALSIYATYGTIKVNTNSVAAKVAITETDIAATANAYGGVSPEAKTEAIIQTVKEAAP